MPTTQKVDAERELPKYKCFKEVHALKIAEIIPGTDGVMITPTDEGFVPFFVDGAYMTKHKPQAGGYYVLYEDGYKSFSPAKAFEDGYVPLERAVAELDDIYTKRCAKTMLCCIELDDLDIDEIKATLKLWGENGLLGPTKDIRSEQC